MRMTQETFGSRLLFRSHTLHSEVIFISMCKAVFTGSKFVKLFRQWSVKFINIFTHAIFNKHVVKSLSHRLAYRHET